MIFDEVDRQPPVDLFCGEKDLPRPGLLQVIRQSGSLLDHLTASLPRSARIKHKSLLVEGRHLLRCSIRDKQCNCRKRN
jgi:hypothetical protein